MSVRALGFFTIFIAGQCYGVHSPDATMLACSFDEVCRRIANRGGHTANFSNDPVALNIANAFVGAIYSQTRHDSTLFGMSLSKFQDQIYTNHLIWAPDGDEAFDDGSHVLQFDVGSRVRLIAFKRPESEGKQDALNDVWLDASTYYEVLQSWRIRFEDEWAARPKI